MNMSRYIIAAAVRYCPNVRFLRRLIAKWEINRVWGYISKKENLSDIRKNLSQKKELIRWYEVQYPARYKTNYKQIADSIANWDGLPTHIAKDELILDMQFCYFAYGFKPSDYICYTLYKNEIDCTKYISEVESIYYSYLMNDTTAMQVYNDKIKTYKMFADGYCREAISVRTVLDYPKFLAFVSRHPVYVKKNVAEACGRSVELIDSRISEGSMKDQFRRLIKQGRLILEEVVKQSKHTAVFNESSVNTVRIITLNTRDGIVAPFAFMKVGRAGAFIDNGRAGGILVGIDAHSGIINSDGIDERGSQYEKHPDSGVTFCGFQLPQWDECVKLCCEMSAKTPLVKCVGWDVAHTENGWVIIEGNAQTEMIGPQGTRRMGVKQEFMGYMKNMDLMIPM